MRGELANVEVVFRPFRRRPVANAPAECTPVLTEREANFPTDPEVNAQSLGATPGLVGSNAIYLNDLRSAMSGGRQTLFASTETATARPIDWSACLGAEPVRPTTDSRHLAHRRQVPLLRTVR